MWRWQSFITFILWLEWSPFVIRTVFRCFSRCACLIHTICRVCLALYRLSLLFWRSYLQFSPLSVQLFVSFFHMAPQMPRRRHRCLHRAHRSIVCGQFALLFWRSCVHAFFFTSSVFLSVQLFVSLFPILDTMVDWQLHKSVIQWVVTFFPSVWHVCLQEPRVCGKVIV